MVDWSEPKVDYSGEGSDRGQYNKSDDIEAQMLQRTAEARAKAQAAGTGWKSEYGDMPEGSRDPRSGRLVIDPLKIPTEDQGAPASFAEYMARRAKQSGGAVKDLAGNDITDVRPTAPVHQGSWGPPAKGSSKDNLDDIFGKKPVSEPVNVLTPEQIEWNRKRDEERAQQEAETEARMAQWMAEAAAKKAAEGGQ
jgi:hypothetical protein